MIVTFEAVEWIARWVESDAPLSDHAAFRAVATVTAGDVGEGYVRGMLSCDPIDAAMWVAFMATARTHGMTRMRGTRFNHGVARPMSAGSLAIIPIPLVIPPPI